MSRGKPSLLDDPRFQKWARRVHRDLLPAVAGADVFVMLAPTHDEAADIKQMLEIGAAILLNKPLLVIVPPGKRLPAKLERVADRIVHGDVSTEAGREHVGAELKRFAEEVESKPPGSTEH